MVGIEIDLSPGVPMHMKQFAALSFALAAGAASASVIHVQTGTYTGPGLFSDPASFQTTVEGAIAAPGATSTWASSYDSLGATINNGALKSTIVFDAATAGADWTFRAGVDFGKGGAIYLDGVLEQSFSHDMWWAGSYSTPGQYFQFTADDLGAGYHTLTLYGLEDCCSGNHQTQYQIGASGFTSFGASDGLPAVPEAQGYAMLLAGLGLVATLAHRRKQA